MKYMKYLLLVIAGALLGAGSVLILQDNSQNEEASLNSTFDGNLIIPFSEEYLIGNDGDTSLYIKFKEDAFHIKEGEEFNYRSAIASSNGDTTLEEAINAPYIEYTEGQYLVRYTVRDKEDSSKSRTYTKLLTVSKN